MPPSRDHMAGYRSAPLLLFLGSGCQALHQFHPHHLLNKKSIFYFAPLNEKRPRIPFLLRVREDRSKIMVDNAADAAAAGHITSLNPHDVLCGRGAGSNEYIGNQRFRDLIDERRDEYTSQSKFEPKKRIAKEIVDKVHARGGRFLRLVNTGQPLDSIVEEGTWEIVKEKVALEKAKQGLREKNPPKRKKQGAVIEKAISQSGQNQNGPSVPLGLGPSLSIGPLGNGNLAGGLPVYPAGAGFPNAMPPVFLGNTGSPVVDPRLLLYQNMTYVQPQMIGMPIIDHIVHIGPTAELYRNALQGSQEQRQFRKPIASKLPPPDSVGTRNSHASDGGPKTQNLSGETFPLGKAPAEASGQGLNLSSLASDDEEAFFALAALSVSDLPKFSEEEETLEKESLTNEEIADILADVFGKHCSVAHHPNKKAKKDLDKESIDFLINFMRREIEKAPDENKQALLKAQEKCKADEFNDARLERFLRCEGMNAKMAATRFINYWTDRRSVFGEEKYTLPMTLSQALRDDLAAIETGVYVELPHRDASGRQILRLDASRYSNDICTPESLVSVDQMSAPFCQVYCMSHLVFSVSQLRAYWYLIEKIALENDDVGRYVGIMHCKYLDS